MDSSIFYKRRSVRNFKNQKVEEEKIDELLSIAMSSPSACNKRPWEFYVVTNEEILSKLKKAGRYTNYNSPLMIICCANLDNALPGKLQNYYYDDLAAASENILLGAVSLELGAVWCGIHFQELLSKRVKEILNLPLNIEPVSMIQIGYPLNEITPRKIYEESKVHRIK